MWVWLHLGGCDRQCPSLQTDFGMCLQLQPSWGTWVLDVLPTHIRGISSYVHPGLWDFPVCPYPFRFQHPSFLPWPWTLGRVPWVGIHWVRKGMMKYWWSCLLVYLTTFSTFADGPSSKPADFSGWLAHEWPPTCLSTGIGPVNFGCLFTGCGTFSSWPPLIAVIAAGVGVSPTVILSIWQIHIRVTPEVHKRGMLRMTATEIAKNFGLAMPWITGLVMLQRGFIIIPWVIVLNMVTVWLMLTAPGHIGHVSWCIFNDLPMRRMAPLAYWHGSATKKGQHSLKGVHLFLPHACGCYQTSSAKCQSVHWSPYQMMTDHPLPLAGLPLLV